MRAKGREGEEKTHQRDRERDAKTRGGRGKSGGKERNSQIHASESV